MTTSLTSSSSKPSETRQKQLEAWQTFQDVARAYEQSLKEQSLLLDAYLQKLESQKFSGSLAAGLSALQERARQDRAYQQAIFWSLKTLGIREEEESCSAEVRP